MVTKKLRTFNKSTPRGKQSYNIKDGNLTVTYDRPIEYMDIINDLKYSSKLFAIKSCDGKYLRENNFPFKGDVEIIPIHTSIRDKYNYKNMVGGIILNVSRQYGDNIEVTVLKEGKLFKMEFCSDGSDKVCLDTMDGDKN